MLEPEITVEADHERLQAEWMRFRQHVVDAATGLPTLAAVLDDVRRLTEERGTTGLLYIDLALRAPATPSPDPVKLMARALARAQGGGWPRPARHRGALVGGRRQVPGLPARHRDQRSRRRGGRDARPAAARPAAGGAAAAPARARPAARLPPRPRVPLPRPHAAHRALAAPRARRGDVPDAARAHAPSRTGGCRDWRRSWPAGSSRSSSRSSTCATSPRSDTRCSAAARPAGPSRTASACSRWPRGSAGCWSWSGCAAAARCAPRTGTCGPA